MFKDIGYNKEYYIGNKLIGSVHLDKPDREIIGWRGMQNAVAEETIQFRKKKIRKGQEYRTMLVKLCGKSSAMLG